MKEYKILTLTPASNSTEKSMESYVTSCETALNQLARDGWQLVCTESIPQQDMSNVMIFLERELTESAQPLKQEQEEVPNEYLNKSDVIVDYPDPLKLPDN